MKRFLMFVLSVLPVLPVSLGGARLAAQVTAVDDTFNEDPTANGWILQGSATWVPPEAAECVDANVFDPAAPCTLYLGEDDGYVLITPPLGNQNGSVFRSERILYDNFKLSAVVELRDGSIARPADGMTIVIVGTTDPPGLGTAGGGMGATGLGRAPTMIFEFDNWSCNTGDQNDQNHVAFSWSPTGFAGGDAAPPISETFTRIDETVYPLNNRQPPPAEPNRFLMEVLVQNGTVAFVLSNDDVGMARTPMYTYKIPNFEPFEGYLGVTASTGGAWQNQIVHSIKIETLPEGFCLAPPATVLREVHTTRPPEEHNGDYGPGDVIDVTLTVSAVRAADDECAQPAGASIEEAPPAGWAASAISDGGAFDAPTGKIRWSLMGAALAAGKTLSYKVTAPDAPDVTASFSGEITEAIALAVPSLIGGESTISKDDPFDACGGLRSWNILGAYLQSGGATPGEERIALDYLTDGEAFEEDFVFFPGREISTAFNGDGVSGALSTGISGGARRRNPGGVPTVFAWNDLDGLIDLNRDVFGGDPNGVMAYAQTYVSNDTGADLPVYLGISSGDSVQVKLNGEEVWINDVARAGADACLPLDTSPDGLRFTQPHVLKKGQNELLVKVFEGSADWSFSLRFQDATGSPITSRLRVQKTPFDGCVRPPVSATRSVDTGETIVLERVERPAWKEGESYEVRIEIADVRGASGPCAPPASVKIEETVPAGWTPSDVSPGGAIAGPTITWTLEGAAIGPTTLSYRVKAPNAKGVAVFRGAVTDPGSIVEFPVRGASALHNRTPFSEAGFIKDWLLLGPYRQPSGNTAAPGLTNIRKDHLTDGAGTTEATVQPEDGDTVNTAYGPSGPARSRGLDAPVFPNGINPGGMPTWASWLDIDDTVLFNDYYGGDLNGVMAYAVTYIDVASDAVVDIGLASDDSIQVLLDGAEVFIKNALRTAGAANTVLDVVQGASVPALNPLKAGHHRLMVKVFEGSGSHAFRLRFQKPGTGEPLTAGIVLCLDRETCKVDSGAPIFHRGDADSNAQLQLTDAIRILGYLFLGAVAPACLDAADADDNGQLQLTDAIKILGYLFLGQAAPAPPGPPGSPCGEDPTPADAGADLGCGEYAGC
ncbi:MAG: hypothetical protein HY721_23030 [Planctomycetes bacterium]|nr:hypothetical protein [Planctomycetota bacterium]